MDKIKKIIKSELNLWVSQYCTFLIAGTISIYDLGIVAKCINVIVAVYTLISAVLYEESNK